MSNKPFRSSTITFLDRTDERKLEIYLSSNHPTVQIKNGNTGKYTPDWNETNLILDADVYLDSTPVTSTATIEWYSKIENQKKLVGTGASITIDKNILDINPIITYICEAKYQNVDAISQITFTRVDTGINGADGRDGTSVNIKGTATSVASVTDTDYYIITYSDASITAAEEGDAYLYNGDLYVCVIKQDDVDYFINVGNIQGPKGNDGQDAQAIFLNATSQVFKKGKTTDINPKTITVTAYPVNTTINSDGWVYSVNGGSFTQQPPTGVTRNGNVVTINGEMIADNVNLITIKASNGLIEDTFTVYKVSDGSDGNPGNPGQPAPIAFLTNESIGFAANSKGQVSTTSAVTNVVAFVGTTSVKPTIGTLSGVPEGMTITQTEVGNEVLLTLSIANNSTLGSSKSNGGRITIPVTIPTTPAITTNLQLGWNKVNAGRSVSSIAARYAVSDSNTVEPTSWSVTIPIRNAGQYLWMADYITYDDGTNATVGPRVVTGDTGTPGISIASVKSYFSNNQSNTSAPAATATWTAAPTRQSGYYTWRKDLITYSDNSTEYTTPVCITGDKGDKGNDGATYYTWIKYADTPTSGMSDSPNDKLYMGIAYNKTTSVESTNYSDYTWSLIKGTSGRDGIDGKTYYTWVKYADDANGANMSDDPLNKSYIGLAYNKTSATESTTASDYQWSLFRGSDGLPGDDAVTFQIYSIDGYILSNNNPKITLQTFAYIGDTQITGDVAYQWCKVKDGVSTAISGANGSSYDVYHSDVDFTNTYMCIMTFRGVEYSGVITIDDKNDINTIFTTKPTSYVAGDVWVVGADYIPSGVEIGTVLKAEHTNNIYSDSDWVAATKYDEHLKALEDNITQYNQYFSFDSQDGLRISARDANGNASQFSTTLSNDRLSFNQGDESVAYIESNKLKIKEAEIVSPLTVTGKYSGSTMQQAPIINIGNFSIVVESNSSLSIVANT